MPYKYNQYIQVKDCEDVKIDQIISDEDYAKIPVEYQSSWKNVVDKPTHTILFEENCIYRCIEIKSLSTRQDDIKNWFAKKI